MLKSMTGQGRASLNGETIQGVLEIHTVNRKILEVHCLLPSIFFPLELELKRLAAKSVARGNVTIRLTLPQEEGAVRALLPLLEKQKRAWEEVAHTLKLETNEVTLPFLLERAHEAVPTLSDIDRAALLSAFQQAMKDVIEMRSREGAFLAGEIEKLLQVIEREMKSISTKSSTLPTKVHEKLLKRLREAGISGKEEELVAREVALLLERYDITEELQRMASHIAQFRHYLKQEAPVGRTLEFLIQEMQREINTLGSKAAEADVSPSVIEVKSTLEKIREQAQNIE